MKTSAFAVAIVMAAAPAFAQFGGLDKVRKGVDTAQKVSELKISEQDERALGEEVSLRVRNEFGVLQNAAVTKYITLVGTVMAQASSRPDLKWEFIVLDTDGVNAFASPGGIVHITKGALGLIKSEAELAGVLAHEISHITKKHTVNAIRQNKMMKMGTDAAPGSSAYIGALANAAYDNIVEKGFDRKDEEDADQEGVRLANKVGYSPAGLSTFLTKLAERNQGVTTRNALFASHPETQGRIDKLGKQVKAEKLTSTATVDARYTASIKFEAKPVTEIAAVVSGSRGLAGDDGKKDETTKDDKDAKAEKKDQPKQEEPKKKKGFGLGSFGLTQGKQAESTQASASAGNRAVGADRMAKGGDNPSKISVTITPAELDAFKKGISA